MSSYLPDGSDAEPTLHELMLDLVYQFAPDQIIQRMQLVEQLRKNDSDDGLDDEERALIIEVAEAEIVEWQQHLFQEKNIGS